MREIEWKIIGANKFLKKINYMFFWREDVLELEITLSVFKLFEKFCGIKKF
jgi:hypothetical protein